MSNLTTFNFNATELRVVDRKGEPWFVGADVCKALDLLPSEYRRLDEGEKTLLLRAQLGLPTGRAMMLISESGLYKLIMRSDKPQARRFQDWVSKVVLPAIRKDGGYIADEENITDEDELVLRAMNILQRKIDRLAEEKQIVEAERDTVVSTIVQNHRTLREFCRKLPHVNLQKIMKDLMDLGYFFRPVGRSYQVRRRYSNLFSERFIESKGWNVISPTEEGIRLLVLLYSQGKLTLKKGFTPETSIRV